jgi:hypothetical protein
MNYLTMWDLEVPELMQHVQYFPLLTKEIVLHKYHVLIETLTQYHEKLEKIHYVVGFQQEQAKEMNEKQNL